MARSHELDRRTFLRSLGAGAGALALGSGLIPRRAPAQPEPPESPAQPSAVADDPTPTSRVTAVHHAGAIRHPSHVESAPDPDVVEVLVDSALLAHRRVGDVAEAWSGYVSPDDRVLVKVDTEGAPNMASNEAVVYAVLRGLQRAGVPAANIRLFDRQRSHLARAHFRVGEQVLGVEVEYGLTRGYRDQAIELPGASCRLASAVDWATAIVAVPVLKDDVRCGVGGACASLGYGLVEEGERLRAEAPALTLAHLCASEAIAGKLRLVVLDGLRLLYEGGPEDGPDKLVHDTIYVSEDPVALDTLAVDRIDEARREHELRTLARAGRDLEWLALAESLGVGVHERDRIRLALHRLAP